MNFGQNHDWFLAASKEVSGRCKRPLDRQEGHGLNGLHSSQPRLLVKTKKATSFFGEQGRPWIKEVRREEKGDQEKTGVCKHAI